ncbi:hypothetical protein JCM10207_008121 [Rhodosporidiobolus poonsookiae]
MPSVDFTLPTAATSEDEKHTLKGKTVSPFDRLPDEVVSLILELVWSPSPTDPIPEEAIHPPATRGDLLICKRFHRLGLPIWFRSVGSGAIRDGRVEVVITRPAVRPLVRHATVSTRKELVNGEIALFAGCPNLRSVSICEPWGEESEPDPPFSTSFTFNLDDLSQITHFSILGANVYDTLDTIPADFSLGVALPNLRSLTLSVVPNRELARLLMSVDNLRHLNLGVSAQSESYLVYGAIPWTGLEHLELRGLDVRPATWTNALYTITHDLTLLHRHRSEDLPPLTLRRLSLTDLSMDPRYDEMSEKRKEKTKQGLRDFVHHLESMGLERLDIDQYELQRWPTKLRTLKVLSLSKVRLYEYSNFSAFTSHLSRFPSLERLYLHDTPLAPRRPPVKPTYGSVPCATWYPHLATLERLLKATGVLVAEWRDDGIGLQWTREKKGEEFRVETRGFALQD